MTAGGDYDPGDARAYSPPPQPIGQPQPGGPSPYSPAPQPTGRQAVPATLGVRFGARLIDGIIVGIVGGILLSILHLTSQMWAPGLFSGLLLFIYFVAFEVGMGGTPGKKIFRMSVLGPGGAPKPTLQQSAIRNSFTLLGIIPFLVGGLLELAAWIYIAVTINNSATKQGKHDELAGGTQVVRS